jgi:hypothetical protein
VGSHTLWWLFVKLIIRFDCVWNQKNKTKCSMRQHYRLSHKSEMAGAQYFSKLDDAQGLVNSIWIRRVQNCEQWRHRSVATASRGYRLVSVEQVTCFTVRLLVFYLEASEFLSTREVRVASKTEHNHRLPKCLCYSACLLTISGIRRKGVVLYARNNISRQ